MNKYFIQLFLRENTVILPRFGALTAPNGNIEEIMFLPHLKTDDGKLAEFIVETEGIDLQDAQNTIAKFIREIETNLSQGESFDIFQFGSFFKNEVGEIEFDSWMKKTKEKKTEKAEKLVKEKEIITPVESESIVEKKVEEIKEVNIVEEVKEVVKKTDDSPSLVFDTKSIKKKPEVEKVVSEGKKKLDKKELRFAPVLETNQPEVEPGEKKKNRKPLLWILGLLSIVAVSVGLYVPLVKNHEKPNTTKVPQNESKKDTLKSKKKPSEAPVEESLKERISQKEQKENTTDAIVQEKKSANVIETSAKGFYLIGGVYHSSRSAEKKISKLEKEGISGKILEEGPKKFYVSLTDFTDRKKASKQLKNFRDKGMNVWILEK
jgi:sulfur relay (sulfurtransferase) DsrC/TusE family protein